MGKNDKPSKAVAKAGDAKASPDAPPAKAARNSKAKVSAFVEATPTAKKAPSAKQIVAASSSWTGKLPATLLHEHCQKLGWEKVTYDMKRTSGGYTATAVLGQRNAKTSLVEHVRFVPPGSVLDPQPTALEARHFTATYALHRVASHKNMQMILPGDHKALWRKLDDLKKTDTKAGRGSDYSADPFVVQRERDEAKADALAKKLEKESLEDDSDEDVPRKQAAEIKKTWERVPVVDMSRGVRRLVENCIRKYHVWDTGARGAVLGKRDTDELLRLGFRRAHVDECQQFASTLQGALEWLLIHVPEDDLPARFLPENYSTGVTLQSASLQAEYAAKRLAQAGYPVELCREVLEERGQDEHLAAAQLMHSLLTPGVDFDADTVPDAVDDEAWREEADSLATIYEARCSSVVPHSFDVKLALEPSPHYNDKNLSLRFYRVANYPETAVPAIALFATKADRKLGLPAYIRLSVTKKVGQYARENLLGFSMCYAMVEWVQEHLQAIVASPEPLMSLSGAVYGLSDSVDAHEAIAASFNVAPARTGARRGARAARMARLDPAALADERRRRLADPKMAAITRTRKSLPAWKKQDEIVAAIDGSQVTLITGETGSGKSTQSMQFIMDAFIDAGRGHEVNMVCTQPRRISAMGLASRVADERGCDVGGQVGYVIRGESKTSRTTQLRFVTTGVVLRMLQQDPERSLQDVSHIFIDEVHERSLDSDFLLIILKRLLRRLPALKVVLMSATVNAEMFSDYFGGAAHVNIEGRTFPVRDLYTDDILRLTGFTPSMAHRERRPVRSLEFAESREAAHAVSDEDIGRMIFALGDGINYDFVRATVDYIDRTADDPAGSILIFMPGTLEISRTIASLAGRYHALPLHAALLPAEQRKVFFAPPKGLRKVVVATNIAETSITIPDVIAVIDSGKVKETLYDQHSNLTRLVETWVSQAAAKQRRGRAGRVAAGTCYKLFTRAIESSKMPLRQSPEICRTPLEQLYLMVKGMHVRDAAGFLSEALDPPDVMAIETARTTLVQVGALDDATSELTALGRHLAQVPADLRCAKLLVYGAIFGCLEVAVVMASVLTVRSPFSAPQDKRNECKKSREHFAGGQGDVIADARAFLEWQSRLRTAGYGATRSWCADCFLSFKTMEDISSTKDQYLSALQEIGFIADTRLKWDQVAWPSGLLRAVLAAAMNPSVARIQLPDKKFVAGSTGSIELDPDAKTIKLFSKDDGRVFIHPSSTLFTAQTFVNNSMFMSYFNKMATSKVFIRELTPFGGYGLLMFGEAVATDLLGRGVTVGNWVRLRCWARVGVLVSRMRVLLDEVLAIKIDNPQVDVSDHEIMRLLKRLVESEGQ
ncbi:P-loop containing nucleoside triphosphate hydrolase protein [Dipodascopsis tothii]|uniref:P-loop containing nucleoside triphosphate hydrolase protein n=1 Tax=Dipodascopsis tothii TaxID=44089 RepID=UPI0034CF3207